MITQPINEASLVTLLGNTRPEARNLANDLGRVPDSMAMPHLRLQLRRPDAQEQALATLIDQLHDPKSPNFHHWLTAAEIGAQFGPAASDISTVTGWLAQHGFTVNAVQSSGMVIDYSGTAGQVRSAFHTDIHYLNVNGVTRFANTTDPQIPAALAPAVAGVLALHDIPPHKMIKARSQYTASGGVDLLLVPADLATIYNFNPLFSGGTSGQGQTIYLLEDTDLYSTSDWSTFRSTFGLSSYTSASLTTAHPGCSDPGVNGDDDEAILDAEWASAAAPSATIVMATCNDILSAIQNLIDGASPPAIMSISYGECEAFNGASANAAFNAIYQQGAAEGTSIFVSSGDNDAAVCDNRDTALAAKDGIAVSGWASTPYNVAVGGTDYSDAYSGTTGTYWNPTNSPTWGSAISYIPEIPWNNSCASQLIATVFGFATTYGSSGFCNSATGSSDFLSIVGGSGGPSGCATGSPGVSGVVSGTCAGWSKPSWQGGFLGNPADGVRDLPDVSLFAANGIWGHYYVFCFSDASNGGNGCSGPPIDWNGAGGTSFSSPIWAGIQALVNQNAGAKQGLPNYRYYQLAAKEYGTSGSSTCNSSNGNGVSSSCIFYDVTLGDNDADCQANGNSFFNCYIPSGTYGVLSTANGSYAPAFATQTGWDFATGIGTVNVANLVNGWLSGGVPLTDAHDFNGDNKSDIFWRDTSGDLAIWEMNGGTILNPSNSGLGSVATTWSIVGQRDFNGDGKADILWRDTSGDLAIWEMSGTTILNPSNSGLGSVPTTWSIVGTGDFNGDGKADILWRDTSGDLAIWEMNGTTILNPNSSGLGNVATNWSVVGVGDFNGDGMSDILWLNSSNGNVAIWEMNGTTILNPNNTSVGNLQAGWFIAGTGDFNGDGKSDILLRDGSGDIAIWEMNGTTILNPNNTSVGNLSTVWSVAETGDFDGNGKSDILWRDTSGDIAIWFMNGTALASGAGLGTISTSFTIQGTNAD
ncbi:MAG TPA: FG-GAP-like repeat-containing protein [Xanthobacteraceae bacterium]|nr:FG-GAP-like repeat-containing protein [Xanthobacteraceae bacterium]